MVLSSDEGDPADVLIETAKFFNADLITVGSVGLTGPSRFLLRRGHRRPPPRPVRRARRAHHRLTLRSPATQAAQRGARFPGRGAQGRGPSAPGGASAGRSGTGGRGASGLPVPHRDIGHVVGDPEWGTRRDTDTTALATTPSAASAVAPGVTPFSAVWPRISPLGGGSRASRSEQESPVGGRWTTPAGQGQAKTGPVGQSRVAITIARMSVTVRVPTTLRPLTGGASEVVVEAETVGEVLDSVDETHPGFRDRLVDDDGSLRRFVNVFVADDDVRFLDGLDTKVPQGRPSRSSRPSPAADPTRVHRADGPGGPFLPEPRGRTVIALNEHRGPDDPITMRSWRAVARSGPGDAPGARRRRTVFGWRDRWWASPCSSSSRRSPTSWCSGNARTAPCCDRARPVLCY